MTSQIHAVSAVVAKIIKCSVPQTLKKRNLSKIISKGNGLSSQPNNPEVILLYR